MWLWTRGIALALGMGVGATAILPVAAKEDDLRVRAFVQAYAPLIDSVTAVDGDVVFWLHGGPIHFRDGRMVAEHRLGREDECDPLFYEYPLEPLVEPYPEPGAMPTYCSDFLESLWGSTEREVRNHSRSVRFLDHRLFVNEILLDPLARLERAIRATAVVDDEVTAWMDDLEITYSFDYREIAGSEGRSQHSWGLAVDFVPSSYEGRAAYWRWSRALDREGWHQIPMDERWSPPQRVIELFEAQGFVWGGKWAHFDAIHFEYRPDIILYSRMAEE